MPRRYGTSGTPGAGAAAFPAAARSARAPESMEGLSPWALIQRVPSSGRLAPAEGSPGDRAGTARVPSAADEDGRAGAHGQASQGRTACSAPFNKALPTLEKKINNRP
ncbi:hypothetical protein GCM10010182_43440 [Actinomadura cremea]|nr:hypothetical protein GCM10010182_43440 [Actinomadura cremea]